MNDVDEHLASLQHPHADVVHLLREIVLAADPSIIEGIKWNSPSFRTSEWFATMNIRPTKPIRMVLHTGAKLTPGTPPFSVDDPDGLLTWLGTDRAIVEFANLAALEQSRTALTALLRQWIAQLPHS